MMILEEKEEGVSPVIGIMLMLVVTIIIAAVIVAFSTGLVSDETQTAPVALIDVGDLVVDGVSLYSVEFVHKGGDSFSLNNTEFSFVGDKQNIANYFFTPTPRDGVHSDGTVSIVGKAKGDVIVSAGDVIKVTIDGVNNDEDEMYYPLEKVTWTLYDLRTDAVIADGTFIVPDSS